MVRILTEKRGGISARSRPEHGAALAVDALFALVVWRRALVRVRSSLALLRVSAPARARPLVRGLVRSLAARACSWPGSWRAWPLVAALALVAALVAGVAASPFPWGGVSVRARRRAQGDKAKRPLDGGRSWSGAVSRVLRAAIR